MCSVGEKPYKCHVCDRSFSESSSRRKHMLSHQPPSEKKESYPCEVCGKVIKTLEYFKEHMAIHTRIKNVECPICSRSFTRKSTLREHIATHAGNASKCPLLFHECMDREFGCSIKERPKEHICELCTRAFLHRASLWRHKKHPCLPLKPTEKAYECQMCVSIFKKIIAQVQGKIIWSVRLVLTH